MTIPYPPGEPLSCERIRALDRVAIDRLGIPGVVLMENAGRHAAEFIYSTLVHPAASRVVVLCGPGNNGGDGFVIARYLHNAGVAIAIVLAAPPEKSQGDAAINRRILEQMGLKFLPAFEPAGADGIRAALGVADVIVDALLGTGSGGDPHGVVADLIQLANAASRARRIAIDIPSGLNADSGTPGSPCFRADATVTLLAPKIGFTVPAAREYVGRVVVVDIGLPPSLRSDRNSGVAALDG
jgi:NAD(P)H-hydrate epimerase